MSLTTALEFRPVAAASCPTFFFWTLPLFFGGFLLGLLRAGWFWPAPPRVAAAVLRLLAHGLVGEDEEEEDLDFVLVFFSVALFLTEVFLGLPFAAEVFFVFFMSLPVVQDRAGG